MIAESVRRALSQSSVTRKMFDEGRRLKARYGDDQVYDLSLGNPDGEPPEAVVQALRETVREQAPGSHHYMSNAGYPATREACARREQRRAGWENPIPAAAVTMTVGAASALTCAFFALLDPGDEVIIPEPYFAEYLNYLAIRQARAVTVPSRPETFQPDPEAIRAAITADTRILLLNSPNNPSGAVYREEVLREIAAVLREASAAYGHPIYIVSDEPYVEFVYDNTPVPSLLTLYEHVIVCYSWSKSFALPGERIGYCLVSPKAKDYDALCEALPLALRILGFVNAPAIWQHVIARTADLSVDVDSYRVRRDTLVTILRDAGYDCPAPQGAFYLLLRAPDGDDAAFAAKLAEERILVVPAASFGATGYVRIAYCVDPKTLEGAAAGFRRVAAYYGLTPSRDA